MIKREFVPDVVILADGDYPSHSVPCGVLESAEVVACCDGAVDAYVEYGGVPDYIVGDGDSVSEKNRERFSSIIVRISEQENNDLTKTVTHMQSLGYNKIAIVGATGKREDHTLGNISLLLEYMKKGLEVRMITDYGTFIPVHGDCEFESFPRQQISIFNFGATGFTGKGLVYPIYDFTSWWQGSLNQAVGEVFAIQATGNYIVFLPHDPK